MPIGGRLTRTATAALGAVIILAAVLCAAAAASAAPARAPAQARAQASAPAVAAPWVELANATTGAVLWSRDARAERPMASITKVMTAYVVIEAGHLSRVITVPSGITGYDHEFNASTAGLVPGERLTALQLLYALLLPSGCDAAYTLATAYGRRGSRASFVAMMNATAKKLGLSRTYFDDFSGLPVDGAYKPYSTARDLIVLGRDAMRLPLLRQIVAQRAYSLASGNGHRAHHWMNLNSLLWSYKGAIGIKTGQTGTAGACLLFEARRGSTTLIGVVLHSSRSSLSAAFGDATKLLNWGFARLGKH